MKNSLSKLFFVGIFGFAGITAGAQCPTITCPSNITVSNDAGNCDAVVNYTAPQGIDSCATGTQTFNYTGSVQVWTVPAGVTSIDFDVRGAKGGNQSTATGGSGGRVQGTIAVTPGQILNIYVGKQGINSGSHPVDPFDGGGGVHSYNSGGTSGTGGGASDIRLNGTTLNDRIVVAGGGGGAGGTTNTSSYAGGNGGGLTGAAGTPWTSWPNSGGKGGTPTTGGIAGVACCSCPTYTTAGQLGIGGNGGGDGAGGGGGGSGYYGGGGSCFGGAGGGSSYTDPSATSTIHTQGFQAGDGQVIISYAGAPISTTQIAGLASGSTFPVGTTTNTFYVSNAFGNDTCSFTVTVNDTELPTIACPTNIVMNNDSGVCGAVVTYTTPVGADNCTGVTTAMSTGLASGSTFPVGVTTVTYVATDASNNQDSCSFTVTVNDTELPTITCPANISSCDSIVNYTAPVGADNCTGVTTAMTAGLASGSVFPIGTTTITYLATDASNNEDSCSFTVTVNPKPAVAIAAFTPDTVCETDPAINLPVGTPATGTYSGNGVVGTTFNPNTAGVGAHYVVYSYTDSITTCSNMDSTMIVVISCVGVDENGALAGVNIYPNPTNNIINITLGNITADVNLTLTSIEGKIVYQENNVSDNKVSVDLSNNSKGIYFLKVETNNQYKVYKVIKE
jgi:hypothetical protein